MVKKNYFINLFAITLMILATVGCSNSAASEEKNAAASKDQTTTTGTSDGKSGINTTTFEEIDVYGEISEVIGNEVTLKLLEIPEMSAQNGERGKNEAKRPDIATGDQAPGTGRGGGMREKNYTGEEKTIVIPVGTPIVSMTRGDNGMEETEINLNELTSGSTLSVYYQEDGKTIEKITIRKPRTGGGPGGPGERPRN